MTILIPGLDQTAAQIRERNAWLAQEDATRIALETLGAVPTVGGKCEVRINGVVHWMDLKTLVIEADRRAVAAA